MAKGMACRSLESNLVKRAVSKDSTKKAPTGYPGRAERKGQSGP